MHVSLRCRVNDTIVYAFKACATIYALALVCFVCALK